jgi:PKD repeat protein
MPTIATVDATGIAMGISAGTDTVTYSVANPGCSATALKVITVNPLPNAGIITGPTSVVHDSVITLTDTVAGGIWSSLDTTLATITPTGLVTGHTAGTDTIKYTVTNGCGTAYTIAVIDILSMRDGFAVGGATDGEVSLVLYPNPSTGIITIEIQNTTSNTCKATLRITDMAGKLITAKNTNNCKAQLNMGQLARGTYMLYVNTENNLFTRKIILE